MSWLFWEAHHGPPHGERLKPDQKVAVGDVNTFIFTLSGAVERTCLGSRE